MRKKTHLENGHHVIDLWPSLPEDFYSDVGLIRILSHKIPILCNLSVEMNHQTLHARSSLDEDTNSKRS